MKTLTMNIGTINGTQHNEAGEQRTDREQYDTIIQTLTRYGLSFGIREAVSDGGDWDPETIFVVKIRLLTEVCLDDSWRAMKRLVTRCRQDAIAIDGIDQIDGGTILFHPNYNGERYLFNRAYFIA